jgi:hypothetical protein
MGQEAQAQETQNPQILYQGVVGGCHVHDLCKDFQYSNFLDVSDCHLSSTPRYWLLFRFQPNVGGAESLQNI